MSDKQIKQKLDGYRSAYQPRDWEAMEALLDKQPRRRIPAWWWFGAGLVGVALLVSAGTLMLKYNSALSSKKALEINEYEGHSNSRVSREVLALATINEEKSSVSNSETNISFVKSDKTEKIQVSDTYSNTPEQSVSKPYTTKIENLASTKLSQENSSREELFMLELQGSTETSISSQYKELFANEPLEEELNLLKLNSGPGWHGFIEAGAGIVSTWPNTVEVSQAGGKYGLRFGFGFGRLTLSSGLLFSHYNYGLDTVSCPTSYPYQCPNTLNAKAKVLEIPITMRVDVFRSERISLWLDAGVALNYKLRETFNYDFNFTNTTSNNPPLPPNNSFEQADENDFIGIPVAGETRFFDDPTSLFATGSGGRSYWAGQLGVGLSYFPSSKIGITTSVRYHHSIKGIGDQPRHLQQLGGWIGISYQFGN